MTSKNPVTPGDDHDDGDDTHGRDLNKGLMESVDKVMNKVEGSVQTFPPHFTIDTSPTKN